MLYGLLEERGGRAVVVVVMATVQMMRSDEVEKADQIVGIRGDRDSNDDDGDGDGSGGGGGGGTEGRRRVKKRDEGGR